MLIKIVTNESEMLTLGTQLASAMAATAPVVFLKGDLGAGKTTLVRGVLYGLGYVGKVKSPTYTLVESYTTTDQLFYHFDLYRIKDENELDYIGIHDYFTEQASCFIEWPEKGKSKLPSSDLICEINIQESTRQLKMIGNSELGEKILSELS